MCGPQQDPETFDNFNLLHERTGMTSNDSLLLSMPCIAASACSAVMNHSLRRNEQRRCGWYTSLLIPARRLHMLACACRGNADICLSKSGYQRADCLWFSVPNSFEITFRYSVHDDHKS
jgi:hypothetical protein